MAKRHKGTGKKPRTIARPEDGTITGAEVLVAMGRAQCEKLVLETLNALCTRTARPDGQRSSAFTKLDLATQYQAACLYLLDRKSVAEVAGLVDISAVSRRVAEGWIKIVKEEYGKRYNTLLRDSATDAGLAAIKHDMAALAEALWAELTVKAMAYLRGARFDELDNTMRAVYLRMAEGLSGQAKTQADIAKARAQTEKINRQLHLDAEAAAKQHGGRLNLQQIAELIDQATGLSRAGEVTA